ncbi:hypothetical protein FNF27_01888 [Cafeteria roenbergensis]|uniref:Uncharacterized protein n=1 Tax=Cafeteria roenbergensis TaxID=33653 RepID=A0A5A8EIZ2_CAFRO|nr:hypothetical protein FNF27_01888 [Cafeteria roenbergensis]
MAARDAYSAALQRLYSANLFLRVKQGLRNTRSLMAGLDSPHLAVPVIHVAGTNGKGSVSWKLAKACEAAGLRTGLFTSPHLSSARERVRINGVPISEQGVIAGLEAVERVLEAEGNPATFFERVTGLAMRHFDEENVDIAILEAGLGGRLDSTNVVEAPLAAVLTTVGMDHTSVLGDTAEQIAWEKSAIAKPGRPFVAGPCTPQALAMTSATSLLGPDAPDLAPEGAGIVLLDAAHNPEAMRAFAKLLEATLAPAGGGEGGIGRSYALRIVLACSNDRSPADMVGPLMPLLAEPGHLFVAEADATKAQSPVALGLAAEEWWRRRRGGEPASGQVNVFQRLRLGEEELSEQARQARADAAAEARRAAGLRAGARLSLDAEQDVDWKSGEVDAASGLGRRYVRAAAPAVAVDVPDGAAGKGTAASTAQASAVQAAVRAAMKSAAADADVIGGRRSPLVVVCGSVYAMREAREAAGVAEPRDAIVK